jgi:ankyrin repeat protein
MVEYLLNKKAAVDARDKLLRTPLHLAALQAHTVLTSLLLENGSDFYAKDKSGRSALHFAVCTGSALSACELITILTKSGQELLHMKDFSGRTALHYAVYNSCTGQLKIIEKLLVLGANVNAVDDSRKGPLHFAAEAGKASVIPILVQNGASTAM